MSLTPPKREQVQDIGRVHWHDVFRPQFGDLLAAGYVDGGEILSFGSTITGLGAAANRVAFREGTALAFPAALTGQTVYAVSSAADTQVWRVQGIDAAGNYQDEEVTLTGTAPVAVPGTWSHVQSAVNTSDGTFNAGNVFISAKSGAGVPTTTADKIQVVALAGDNYGINPELQCPNNKIILIHRFDFSTNTANDSTVRIEANRQGTWILNFTFFCDFEYHQDFNVPLRLYPGDKLRVTIEASAGNNTNASFGMNGMVWTDTRTQGSKIAGGVGQLYGPSI